MPFLNQITDVRLVQEAVPRRIEVVLGDEVVVIGVEGHVGHDRRVVRHVCLDGLFDQIVQSLDVAGVERGDVVRPVVPADDLFDVVVQSLDVPSVTGSDGVETQVGTDRLGQCPKQVSDGIQGFSPLLCHRLVPVIVPVLITNREGQQTGSGVFVRCSRRGRRNDPT